MSRPEMLCSPVVASNRPIRSNRGKGQTHGEPACESPVMYSTTESYFDKEGTLRRPGEQFCDGDGILRRPGEMYADYEGVRHQPGEHFYDSEGTLRKPGELFCDGEGIRRRG